jgi:hypothetical protein
MEIPEVRSQSQSRFDKDIKRSNTLERHYSNQVYRNVVKNPCRVSSRDRFPMLQWFAGPKHLPEYALLFLSSYSGGDRFKVTLSCQAFPVHVP